eukprot:TRINITY_DN1623_c0_g4_i2.p1 TRINITY_DN1623_c0_g4~~TRINITY_DN1623_c0_g4_i2.p1  ORF type:complete len:157 (-),score=23.53 TRINITY_DN1623_c0_g4_i2:46-516(-)
MNTLPSVSPLVTESVTLPSPCENLPTQNLVFGQYIQFLSALGQNSPTVSVNKTCFFGNYQRVPESQEGPRTENQGEEKKTMAIRCPHPDRKHYAKNMCSNCYHKLGRIKKAWNCPHTHKAHYSKGKCQMCYLFEYHQNKKMERRMKRTNAKSKISQ